MKEFPTSIVNHVQNFFGTRFLNSVYQNTKGRHLFVFGTIELYRSPLDSPGVATVEGAWNSINNFAGPHFSNLMSLDLLNANEEKITGTVQIIVPPSWYYTMITTISANSTVTILDWTEAW